MMEDKAMMQDKSTIEDKAAKSALGGRMQAARRKFRRGRADESGLTTLEWLLIVAAVAGLAALAVVLVQQVVDDTAEEISSSSARGTAARSRQTASPPRLGETSLLTRKTRQWTRIQDRLQQDSWPKWRSGTKTLVIVWKSSTVT